MTEPNIIHLNSIDHIFSGDIKSIYHLFSTYMQIDVASNYMIELILAVALSIRTGDPIWLMIVAPPSSGKTESLNLITKYKYVHPFTNVTPKFLFSGHKDAKGGYVPREVGKQGVLVFPDFTTLINNNPNHQKEIFNHFRVIHDGSAGIATGIDSGKQTTWKGKVAVIACVTQSINLLKSRNNEMGERFLYYNFWPPKNTIPQLYPDEQTKKAKSEIQKLVNKFLSQKSRLKQLPVAPKEVLEKLYIMSDFICHMRAPVVRSRNERDIIQVNPPEQPHRIFKSLVNLYRCLLLVNENEERTFNIVKNVCKSTVPIERLMLVKFISKSNSHTKYQDVFNQFSLSSSKLRREIEDLAAQKILSIKKVSEKNLHEITIHTGFLPKWENLI